MSLESRSTVQTSVMKRRTVLAGLGAAGLARPGIVRAASATTLRFIPQIDLVFLDPHFSTTNVTRNHSQMVFDTLFGCDSQYRPAPQMLQGHTVEDDGRLWRLTLRPGLVWHDGVPVLARDCVASVRRWAKRDTLGEALIAVTDELTAPDDRTIQFRLRKRFPLLPDALGKAAGYMPAMMPERMAMTEPGKLTDIIGSGPFQYVANERLQGSRNVYRKFEAYRPREGGTTDWCAGPKIVNYERVEWTTMPDGATAAAALQAGEQDWWEQVTPDLLAMLNKSRAITTTILDTSGSLGMMRPNHSQPPFDNPAIRRALLRAVDQKAEMQAIMGENTASYHVPVGMFLPGSPSENDAGMEVLTGPKNYAAIARDIKAAGYAGEPVTLMVPTDYLSMHLMGQVFADTMRRVGMTVDLVSLDWATVLQRRMNKGPVDKGGWHGFITSQTGTDWLNPATHYSIRGNGAAYPGWFFNARLEELRNTWFDAPDAAAQKAICREVQTECMRDVPLFPLGQFVSSTAYRGLAGVMKGFPMFWNVKPA